MKKFKFIWSIGISFFVFGCSPSEISEEMKIPDVYKDDAIQEEIQPGSYGLLALDWVHHITEYFPLRLSYTYEELAMAEWIIEELIAMGFKDEEVIVTRFSHPDFNELTWSPFPSYLRVQHLKADGFFEEMTPRSYSQNVSVTLSGKSEKTIVLGAHYDSFLGQGASDNASGVALLLETIYRLRDYKPYYTLKFIFFGAEEVGLVGSLYFLSNLTQEERERIVFMINMDVLFDGDDLVVSTGYVYSLSWDRTIRENEKTRRVGEVVLELNENYGLELLLAPDLTLVPTDQLSFLSFDMPVAVIQGIHLEDYPYLFRGDVMNSYRDTIPFLKENFPGRMERSLEQFSKFLNRLLVSKH